VDHAPPASSSRGPRFVQQMRQTRPLSCRMYFTSPCRR
jgi:hypothetical protein